MSTLNDTLTALGNAVRSKTGTSGNMTLAEMTTAINNMQVGDGLRDVTSLGYSVTSSQYRYDETIKTYTGNSVNTVESFGFNSCIYLRNVDIPNATEIKGSAFLDCKALTSINCPKVTSIGLSAFKNAVALTKIDVPLATSINESAFENCINLYSVDATSATFIGDYAFRNCASLTTLTFANCATIASAAFSGCSSLTDITLPNVTDISVHAFCGCYRLTNLTLSNPTTVCTLEQYDPSESMPTQFYGCPNIVVKVPSSLLSAYKSATGWSSLGTNRIQAI